DTGLLVCLLKGVLKNLVNTGTPKIAVDEQNTMALLRQRQCVIHAGKTFSFVRQGTGKKKNLAIGFRSEQGKGSAQIPEALGNRSTWRFVNQPVSCSSN